MWVSRNSLAAVDYRADPEYYQELGALIGHDKKVIELSGDYGYRLEYFGWVNGALWPGTADTNVREMAGQTAPEFADYTAGQDLFVITSLDELNRQPELRDTLAADYPVWAQGEGYLIYDLRH
jgi:hypothetical protein